MTATPLPLLTSPRGQAMLQTLPPLYDRSRVLQGLLQAEGLEADVLRAAVADVLAQAFVRTATWGLDWWESELALPPLPLLTTDERRDRIVAKLRGYGTSTVPLLKRIAEAYDRGAVDVIEDFEARVLTFRFVDTTGIPSNLADLKVNVRAVAQAQLLLAYLQNYLTWQDFDAQNWTWADFDALNLTWHDLETYA